MMSQRSEEKIILEGGGLVFRDAVYQLVLGKSCRWQLQSTGHRRCQTFNDAQNSPGCEDASNLIF